MASSCSWVGSKWGTSLLSFFLSIFTNVLPIGWLMTTLPPVGSSSQQCASAAGWSHRFPNTALKNIAPTSGLVATVSASFSLALTSTTVAVAENSASPILLKSMKSPVKKPELGLRSRAIPTMPEERSRPTSLSSPYTPVFFARNGSSAPVPQPTSNTYCPFSTVTELDIFSRRGTTALGTACLEEKKFTALSKASLCIWLW
mmetsp:Transcript_3597/g.5320  ORF Transcript_3597/g.5320 Transcript_3597/m.5320 type:complete len:202 (-) Transcript_3597:521-1126(-)